MCRAQIPTAQLLQAGVPTMREGKYKLGAKIGEGAFSTVYEATRCATGEALAVKVVPLHGLEEVDKRALEREISIGLKLRHEGVMSIEDFVVAEDAVLMLQTRCHGDLFRRIKRKTCYSEDEARPLVTRLLEALAYLHARGIIHRDLKPENILMLSEDDDAACKIADFGFARRVTDEPLAGEAVGTPAYVAPEVLHGEAQGTSGDIWSLGVVVYCLLVGYAPFYAATHEELFAQIAEARFQFHPKFWGHVSLQAKDFIRCMIAAESAERWTADELLRHPWLTGVALASTCTWPGCARPAKTATLAPAEAPKSSCAAAAAAPAPAAGGPQQRAAAAAAAVEKPAAYRMVAVGGASRKAVTSALAQMAKQRRAAARFWAAARSGARRNASAGALAVA